MLVPQSGIEKANNMSTKNNQAEAEAAAIEAEMMSILQSEGTLRAREERFHAVHGPDYADYSREHRSQDGSGLCEE